MKRNSLLIALFFIVFCGAACAQDIAGDWQGVVNVDAKEPRLIVHIEKSGPGWKATLASIDQIPDRGATIAADSVSAQGADVKIGMAAIHGSYAGTLSADGMSMAGTWTQGVPLPLELKRATPETAWKDPSPHLVQFVNVDKDVKLEVLDWGGSGRPLVLVAGLADTAHCFDQFALKLIPQYHVYGITRRGFGASSSPTTSYTADRLGDDVLAVLDALKIEEPVLVGHSLGGEELSSVGSRHPERVAGLIYLDAGYNYAFYDQSRGNLGMDLADLEKNLLQLHPGNVPADPRPLVKELLESALPGFERDLHELQKDLELTSFDRSSERIDPPFSLTMMLTQAGAATLPMREIRGGLQKYNRIPVPILAIYAVPHDRGPFASPDPKTRAAREARDEETTGAQAKAFENGLPNAKVVRIPHADHYVFRSNEVEVLHYINEFVAGLK